ncbi:uracil-DNA glycosylase family protein [Azospirillum doebereinerae]|uniref:Uracil-DNA glycosylase family protein n=1 Tax=Azospirillum doebereinerae TaxID=92933 RepID=A0A3S0V3V2_9PROT|nr:uracil-DNA glycosylase family protein [Azospirillum doebereinerae]MCG5242008.1 uracil-DNA glycosylase family protein [Azospirillum doebereinerae]RUQ65082.1 uracil-DNA glycosylase family protein [Azospirillum doebereinerae]
MSDIESLFAEVRACTLCAGVLPHGCRPVMRGTPSSRLLIVGQAPGARVHASGIPWNDPSGDRLRRWLDMGRDAFYDESRIAVVPMGLCYPGTAPPNAQGKSGGDYPPRPECAPLWHPPLLAALTGVRLTLLIGQYAQARYLGAKRKASMTETVAAWREYGPAFLPLPHPSWRNTAWLNRNPWFDEELVPVLRRRVAEILAD